MGCSHSRLDDEEAVQLCKDRKRFIKQAVEQRTLFATGHIAYIESLKRVSAALRDYIEGDEPREFSLDSVITPPFTPVKRTTPAFIPISAKPFTPTTAIEFGVGPNSTLKVNYLRPGGNPAISVEERPQSPEMVRVETYPPMQHYGIDGFFNMQSSPANPSIFAYSPNNRPNIPPSSPQASQWDFFWNPFSSLDYYGYPARSSLEHAAMDDEYKGLRQVREEEGIPDLEEDETEQEYYVGKRNVAEERTRNDVNSSKEEVIVEDVDDEDEDEDEEEDDEEEEEEEGTDIEIENKTDLGANNSQAHGSVSFDVSKAQTAGHVESSHREMAVGKQEAKDETPGFTVYVNRRPTSMAEVINDLEAQFTIVCNAANDVSALLEAKKSQYLLTSNELSASKLLNPVALLRSASSRSSSSRFLMNNSSTRKEGCDGTKDLSEEHCMLSGSHQSTLDRLNAWEKKLYEEVKSGERVRIAYEKKCKQLRNLDVKGEDPSCADKTRSAIRDLDTQITVSIHSVEAISRRIETLRDEELHPQLLELVQGLERMWKVMAECHQTQKRTLDEAKILLAGTPSKSHARKHSSISMTDPNRLARSASNLESELRNWRNTFESWITSQRSYIHSLTGWLLRCVRSEPDASKLPCSPHRSSGTHPLFGLCVQWSRRLDAIHEKAVLDGLDFFAAGMGSLYAHQLREDSRRNSFGSKQSYGNMEMVEVGEVEDVVMAPEKLAEVAIKVLCAGMSVAISSLAEFSLDSAEGYNEVVKQWENVKCQQHTSSEARTS
ncbi:nitrate regulatory gene2 protein-like [Abrus precatorius]|uniref:Nitrate regulatory gene2 protein-like n=1 Tax=Abrus precatorius TaxID=3816 RepID=A0A8B8K815_ABRPR|nr:nitrate regulatory gene2 protein-like [Abrus precatorius]